MSDLEFIKYLSEKVWELSRYAGDDNYLDVIEEELKVRNINPDDIFVY